MNAMNILGLIGFGLFYFVVVGFVLPRLGVPT